MEPEVKKTFILGIVSAALCGTGLPGLIVGIIGLKSTAESYAITPLAVRARIGKYLSIYGIAAGAMCTLIWAIYIIVMLVVFGMAASGLG